MRQRFSCAHHVSTGHAALRYVPPFIHCSIRFSDIASSHSSPKVKGCIPSYPVYRKRCQSWGAMVKLVDKIKDAATPWFSFEFFPPRTEEVCNTHHLGINPGSLACEQSIPAPVGPRRGNRQGVARAGCRAWRICSTGRIAWQATVPCSATSRGARAAPPLSSPWT